MKAFRLLWMLSTTTDEANRRAGGRRRYNAERKAKARERQRQLAEQFDIAALDTMRGGKARVARLFGVSAATIGRDVRAILASNRMGATQ